jgi:hypothetical protein
VREEQKKVLIGNSTFLEKYKNLNNYYYYALFNFKSNYEDFIDNIYNESFCIDLRVLG